MMARSEQRRDAVEGDQVALFPGALVEPAEELRLELEGVELLRFVVEIGDAGHGAAGDG